MADNGPGRTVMAGMKVTVTAAMRARDVSRPHAGHEALAQSLDAEAASQDRRRPPDRRGQHDWVQADRRGEPERVQADPQAREGEQKRAGRPAPDSPAPGSTASRNRSGRPGQPATQGGAAPRTRPGQPAPPAAGPAPAGPAAAAPAAASPAPAGPAAAAPAAAGPAPAGPAAAAPAAAGQPAASPRGAARRRPRRRRRKR
jgi:hypothetical protein